MGGGGKCTISSDAHKSLTIITSFISYIQYVTTWTEKPHHLVLHIFICPKMTEAFHWYSTVHMITRSCKKPNPLLDLEQLLSRRSSQVVHSYYKIQWLITQVSWTSFWAPVCRGRLGTVSMCLGAPQLRGSSNCHPSALQVTLPSGFSSGRLVQPRQGCRWGGAQAELSTSV